MAAVPDIGDPAPDFTLPSTEGDVALADRLKAGPVLLVFYPGDNTPVCTKQLCDYRDNLDVFADLRVQVLAVNPQKMRSHEKFAAKHDFPFPLLADAGGAVCKAYGALNFLGQAKRALVLIGTDGGILYRQVDIPLFRRTADELAEVLAECDLG